MKLPQVGIMHRGALLVEYNKSLFAAQEIAPSIVHPAFKILTIFRLGSMDFVR
jgi:hypothetical protein